ncbi:hypothetical protein [Idiomarina xiamenensis]|uniref:Uncharacterized protein n=1 Tax=Idiomarina xiamenensis 10-D-4 TaxID=740709 RepID=K2KFQ6_9GAMM|nr:hypothetical protein [Idiomarina xiamenensis]EKE86838.1 hypothetical protein A10D4_01312 [Idiomarina xiamenensis 10-D-4]
MNLNKRIVILAGAVGLMFYTASQEQLISVIADYHLSWYRLGVPVAWGIILGGLAAFFKLSFLQRWLAPLTLIASGLLTMGLIGAAASYVKHELAVLTLPALQLATIGLGLYLVGYAYARMLAGRDDDAEQ